jgi:transposase InsO family protein
MGRPGSALDNAVIEAWHSTVEWELRRAEHFATKAAARARVAAWIEEYNTTRRHSALGMLAPVAYEALDEPARQEIWREQQARRNRKKKKAASRQKEAA